MAAKYELERVQAAARDGNVAMDEARAWDLLTPFFDTMLECQLFAADVVLSLRVEDWRQTVRLPNPPHAGEYDEYFANLSEAVRAKHGVENREWYLKLRLTEGFYGDDVFLVSLHVPERPTTRPRSGGRL